MGKPPSGGGGTHPGKPTTPIATNPSKNPQESQQLKQRAQSGFKDREHIVSHPDKLNLPQGAKLPTNPQGGAWKSPPARRNAVVINQHTTIVVSNITYIRGLRPGIWGTVRIGGFPAYFYPYPGFPGLILVCYGGFWTYVSLDPFWGYGWIWWHGRHLCYRHGGWWYWDPFWGWVWVDLDHDCYYGVRGGYVYPVTPGRRDPPEYRRTYYDNPDSPTRSVVVSGSNRRAWLYDLTEENASGCANGCDLNITGVTDVQFRYDNGSLVIGLVANGASYLLDGNGYPLPKQPQQPPSPASLNHSEAVDHVSASVSGLGEKIQNAEWSAPKAETAVDMR